MAHQNCHRGGRVYSAGRIPHARLRSKSTTSASRSSMAGYDFTTYDIDDDEDDGPCHSGCCKRPRTRTSSSCPVTPITTSAPPTSKKSCTSNIQLVLLLMALVGGVGLGILLRTVPPYDDPNQNPRAIWYLYFPAEMIVRFMTFLATPLLVSSVLSGVASLRTAGTIGGKAIAFYIGTTCLACAQGIAYVLLIHPTVERAALKDVTNKTTNKIDLVLDTIRNMAPESVFEAATTTVYTKSSWELVHSDLKNDSSIESLSLGKKDSFNLTGLMALCFIFAVTFKLVPQKSRPLRDFFDAVYEVIMAMVKGIIWILPVAILFMITVAVVKMKDPVVYAKTMFLFLATVSAGLATHFLLVMPLLLLVLARTNPFKHLAHMARALVTALGTSNSIITLPVTMDCLKRNAHYDSRLVRFLCPVGAIVNMDGTCLYEVTTVIFIATIRGVSFGPIEVVTTGALAILLSIGSPVAASKTLTLSILLETMGLPTDDIILLLPFDWILGRLRTAVNIWGDSIAVAVIAHFSEDQLLLDTSDVSDVSSVSDDVSIGMVMNGSYRPCDSTPSRRKSYTLTVQNESGDVVKVSKV